MGFVVTVHEGAYEQVLSRELIILLRHVMPLNEENFHLIMPVVKGHCARDKPPLTLISACLNPVKMILPQHHDVIIRKHFPRYWPFVWGIQRSPVNIPHKDQWCGALIFSLICAWINDWVNNREAGDLRRHRAHHDVIVMIKHIEDESANLIDICNVAFDTSDW